MSRGFAIARDRDVLDGKLHGDSHYSRRYRTTSSSRRLVALRLQELVAEPIEIPSIAQELLQGVDVTASVLQPFPHEEPPEGLFPDVREART